MMNPYAQGRQDEEMKNFAAGNFERPLVCWNANQIRFYNTELCLKIAQYETRFNSIPACTYALLDWYNAQLKSGQKVAYH